jgi:hypothetical protein
MKVHSVFTTVFRATETYRQVQLANRQHTVINHEHCLYIHLDGNLRVVEQYRSIVTHEGLSHT